MFCPFRKTKENELLNGWKRTLLIKKTAVFYECRGRLSINSKLTRTISDVPNATKHSIGFGNSWASGLRICCVMLSMPSQPATSMTKPIAVPFYIYRKIEGDFRRIPRTDGDCGSFCIRVQAMPATAKDSKRQGESCMNELTICSAKAQQNTQKLPPPSLTGSSTAARSSICLASAIVSNLLSLFPTNFPRWYTFWWNLSYFIWLLTSLVTYEKC